MTPELEPVDQYIRDIMEEKINAVDSIANNIQDRYEETWQNNYSEDKLKEEIGDYSKTLVHVNEVHNIVYNKGFEDLADEVSGIFEELLNTQAEYKQEAIEKIGYSPSQVFAEIERAKK